MSLVVDTFANDWRRILHQSKSHDGNNAAVYTQLAQIAIAPILIDTINLTAQAKIQPKDLSSAKLLETEFMAGGGGNNDAAAAAAVVAFDQTAYYDAITAAKEDLSRLTLRDVLRKDYKEWEEGGIKLGISCVVQDLDFLLHKAASKDKGSSGQDVLLSEMHAWAQEQTLDIVAVMTTSNTPEGEFQRYLLVWGVTGASASAVKRFKEDATGKLRLNGWKDGVLDETGSRYAWRQMALDASRKQVAPLLRDAMKWAGANL